MAAIDLFISDLTELCKEHEIILHLPDTKSVKCGKFSISGYFDESTLACAMGKKDSITTLVHESCHLDQFIEKIPLWTKKTINYDDWLLGKEFTGAEVDKSLNAYKWLELDCEKRAIKKLKKYKIPHNRKEYIQRANAYVQFYNYIKLSRKWCNKNNTPYNNKNIWRQMPEKFMPKKWYEQISEEYIALFIQNNI